MCGDPHIIGYGRQVKPEPSRRERLLAATSKKCQALLFVDDSIEFGGSISDVLRRALPFVKVLNLGAADTIQRLLAMEEKNGES